MASRANGTPRKLRKLYPSFADLGLWRGQQQIEESDQVDWQCLRARVLKRDDFTCQYCGYRSEKYQIVHHLDENPINNDESNLTTICQMCNLIVHSGQGCVVKGIVELYKKSNFNQNEIVQITREMRDKGKTDLEIMEYLGLRTRMPFKMDKPYLRKLFALVTSRPTRTGDDMYDGWKAYHVSMTRGRERSRKEKRTRNKHGRNHIKIYYSHSMKIYDTETERKEMGLIEREFPNAKIVNPPSFEGSIKKQMEGMAFCHRLIDECDILVFSRLMGVITSGVGDEVNYALRKKMNVFEIKKGSLTSHSKPVKCVSRQQTRHLYRIIELNLDLKRKITCE